MSFCERCKDEISSLELKQCCMEAHLYGMLLFAKNFSVNEIYVSAQDDIVLEHMLKVFKSFGVSIDESMIKKKRGKNAIIITDDELNDRIISDFGYSGIEPSLRINKSNFFCADCRAAFLSGVFLSAGTMTDPEKGYHLEFSMHKQNLLNDLSQMLTDAGFSPKISKRRELNNFLYFKESTQIEDLLTYMGATDSSLEFMQAKIYHNVVNVVNRRTNCENANIDKLINSSGSDIADIKLIYDTKGHDYLPAELREAARLRFENPDFSLAELAAMCEEPMSKSGYNHRLRKIRSLAANIREKNDVKT